MSPQTTVPISNCYINFIYSFTLSWLITFQKRYRAAHNDAKNTRRRGGQKGKQEESTEPANSEPIGHARHQAPPHTGTLAETAHNPTKLELTTPIL